MVRDLLTRFLSRTDRVCAMLAIIIPAHNEEALLDACLTSALRAAGDPALAGEHVQIIVVADNCTDGTEAVAEQFPVITLVIFDRNVGAARAAGADYALALGARWLAFTDADTTVPCDWLSQQLACDAEVVCGVINVDDWMQEDTAVHRHFDETYTPVDGHRHIHGANLAISADAYRRVGGFTHLQSDEDVDLVGRLERIGASICWSAQTRVWTSSRSEYRAPNGFGATLAKVRSVIADSFRVDEDTTALSQKLA
ncbi:glycosyltransferase involved in cell wall biosynthesis [Paraburkholderia sp. GAS199]|uniref:glycosyltransferase n=1 Tax=Paraburkholderia sp. GAS199 TaxID=3035126 RepID=UPI003D1E38E3